MEVGHGCHRGDAECEYDDIGVEEADDGDFITVRGERYTVCAMIEDFSDSAEHHEAMAERAAITANAAARIEINRLEAKVAFLEHG
jgi:hypothetical protein